MTTNRTSYSSGNDPSRLAKAIFDELSRRYHEERHQKIVAEISDQLVRYRPAEAMSLLNLALSWAPYGGVPEEMVFEQYGTTLSRFVDQMWTLVHHLDCDRQIVDKLAAAYPRHQNFFADSARRALL